MGQTPGLLINQRRAARVHIDERSDTLVPQEGQDENKQTGRCAHEVWLSITANFVCLCLGTRLLSQHADDCW